MLHIISSGEMGQFVLVVKFKIEIKVSFRIFFFWVLIFGHKMFNSILKKNLITLQSELNLHIMIKCAMLLNNEVEEKT